MGLIGMGLIGVRPVDMTFVLARYLGAAIGVPLCGDVCDMGSTLRRSLIGIDG
jgi:hypothetical protein